MRYLQKSLLEGERPICRSRLHGIYLAMGIFWFLLIAGIGWIADYNLWLHFGLYIPAYEIGTPWFEFGIAPGQIGWLCTAGGAFIFGSELLKLLSTDVVLTTKRLLYKTGFIKIKVDATDIGDILGVHIDQGWLGQFLGYGRIHLDCRFIEDVYIPYVKNPYGIMKNLQKAKAGDHPAVAPSDEKQTSATQPISQTLIQISGSGPVYLVDKVPNDPKTPLHQLPRNLGDNLLAAFKRKA